MIIIKYFTCYPTYPDTLRVYWEICHQNNQQYGPQYNGDYKFILELLGPDKLSVIDTPVVLYNKYYHDFKLIPLLSFHTLPYIRITCYPPKGPEQIAITSINHGLEDYELNIAAEISRKEQLLFERKIGRRCDVFKRKYIGSPCTNCTDIDTGATTNSNCEICYGTKYGFYQPIEVWCDIVEGQVEKAITEIGTSENRAATARLTNTIIVNKNDVLYDKITETKWLFTAEPQIVRYRSFPVSQIVPVSAISPKSIIYKIKG